MISLYNLLDDIMVDDNTFGKMYLLCTWTLI